MRLNIILLVLLACMLGASDAWAQRASKYGADFLAGGVGARALGMGGAQVGIADDVTSGFWNPAGLDALTYPQLAYMHAERFSGTVAYDYAAWAMPLTNRSSVALSVVRTGVDDIPNTLNAWDRERNQPLPNVGDRVTRFSYAHYAVFVGYARRLNDRVSVGASGKIVRGLMGDFASSVGYSFDLGARYRTGRFELGANLQDATRMLQTWSINEAAFEGAELSYDDFEIPKGGSDYVLPVLRLGSGWHLFEGRVHRLMVALDTDVHFDGARHFAYNVGGMALYPRVGAEYTFRDLLAFRTGLSHVGRTEDGSPDLTPSLGAGLKLSGLQVDYAFGDFAGLSSDLGFSHRVSLQWTFRSERMKRPDTALEPGP